MSIPFRLALILAALSGWMALAYEIMWARVYSFVSAGRPVAFATMLSSYLLGLALGSLWSRHWQREGASSIAVRHTLSRLVIFSNLAAFLVAPAVSWGVVMTHWSATLPLVALGAALLGILLPLLCHAAIPANQASGKYLSYIYISNIIGSGLGTLLAGLLFFEWFGLGQIAGGLLVLALVISLCLAGNLRAARWPDWLMWAGAAVLAASSPWLHRGLYERLQFKHEYARKPAFVQIVETRHGVITVDNQKIVYGGGVYDGVIDVRPHVGLLRPYFFSAVHPAPKEILVIGVSGGAWTQILANHPQAEHVTAVEINDGYFQVIAAHPEVSSLLTNPKVTIVIDDGRRWLRRNPNRNFDLVVMNTTFNWREFASALLGREFLEQIVQHLKPGGIVMWNCTGSGRAARTGMAVFPYTMMLKNNCLGSMSPLVVNRDRWRSVLARYRIDGKPVFDLATADGRRALDEVIAYPDSPAARVEMFGRDFMDQIYGADRVITDDNLGDEYSFGVRHNLFLKYLFRSPQRPMP